MTDAKRLTGYAKDRRCKTTEPERMLWDYLRSSRLDGLEFLRGHALDRYTVDFACPEKLVAIELVCSGHDGPERRQDNRERNAWLRDEGYSLLVIRGCDVMADIESVLEDIRTECARKVKRPSGREGKGKKGSRKE